MSLLRMLLGGCWFGELRGVFSRVRVSGLGHDFEIEVNEVARVEILRCSKCGERSFGWERLS